MFQDELKSYILITCSISVLLINFELTSNAQSPITSIATTNSALVTNTRNNIKGAGFPFSLWATTANFTVNYSSDPIADITQVTSFNTTFFNNIQVYPISGAIVKIRREANATITDTRNFITAWNRISSGPVSGAASGTFNCIAPEVTSMEAALLTNNINSGYDNTFQNDVTQPHYNNIERVDFIIPDGVDPIMNLNEMGFAVFDRGVGDPFKIAAITSLDASNNPSGYSNLISVTAANFSAAGLLGSNFDYTIFVSDPLVASGENRPSTRQNQNIRGVFISFQDLGIAINQKVYGYSLFAQDVFPGLGHVLTDPSTFPINTSFASMLDLVNVMSFYKTNNALVPVKIHSFAVSLQSNKVLLSWKTATEENIQTFNVERRNSSGNWEFVQSIQSLNNPNGSSYQLTDKIINATNKYYYRVKTIGKDGSAEYSKVIAVDFKSEKTIQVHYNGNRIIISSDSEIDKIQMFDVSGRVSPLPIPSQRFGLIEIPVSTVQKGIYFLGIVTKEGERKVTKIIL